jgi:hypothetical protein
MGSAKPSARRYREALMECAEVYPRLFAKSAIVAPLKSEV